MQIIIKIINIFIVYKTKLFMNKEWIIKKINYN